MMVYIPWKQLRITDWEYLNKLQTSYSNQLCQMAVWQKTDAMNFHESHCMVNLNLLRINIDEYG